MSWLSFLLEQTGYSRRLYLTQIPDPWADKIWMKGQGGAGRSCVLGREQQRVQGCSVPSTGLSSCSARGGTDPQTPKPAAAAPLCWSNPPCALWGDKGNPWAPPELIPSWKCSPRDDGEHHQPALFVRYPWKWDETRGSGTPPVLCSLILILILIAFPSPWSSGGWAGQPPLCRTNQQLLQAPQGGLLCAAVWSFSGVPHTETAPEPGSPPGQGAVLVFFGISSTVSV